MKAAVIDSPGTLEIGEVPDPTPGPDDIVVAVQASGICGTDIHLYDGEFDAAVYPLIPGHEFAGEVVAAGAAVSTVKVGDLVAVDPSLYCGHCRTCRQGHGNLCEDWHAIGITHAGAAAEFVAAPVWNAQLLPAGFDPTIGALIEPLSCAVHAYDVIGSQLGDRFLVYGAGTMGLLLLSLAARAGAISTTVVEPNPARRRQATGFGATEVVAAGSELEPGRTWDVVIDATGVVAAIEDAIGRVKPGGTYLQFGVAPADASAQVSPFRIYNQELRVTGSMSVLESYDRACDLATELDLGLDRLVSDRLPLTSYAAALERVRKGDGYKIQVAPGLD